MRGFIFQFERTFKIPPIEILRTLFYSCILCICIIFMSMTKKNSKGRVFVAMSGGVDSSVAALLLKKQGYDVIGVFMKYWMDPSDVTSGAENRCCSLEARRDAMKVCAHLEISCLTFDFQKEFKKAVVDEFVSGYKMGITPNPCVTCNKEIKLGLFIKKAFKEGADFVATGHYAKVVKSRGAYRMSQAKDVKKDQSYFLYNLSQDSLSRILFPLGNLVKDEVRKIAEEVGLPVATKKDSQEVCFVKNGGLKEFLSERMNMKNGDIISDSGEIVGRHEGVESYTIGQRAPVGGIGPYYVISKDKNKNQLIVANRDSGNLFSKEMIVRNVNWTDEKSPKLPLKCRIKTRYQSDFSDVVLSRHKNKNEIKVLFKIPQRAVTPGQSAVFYKSKEVLGGGIIDRLISKNN